MALIEIHTNEQVQTLTLNRADKLNALNRDMYRSMADGFLQANKNSAIKAILVTGQPGIFTAGNDLADFAAAAAAPERRDNPALDLMKAILNCEKPIVATVDGPAIGIGTTLLFHCDLVYASNNARFHTPFAQLGVCPEFASSQTFAQLMGHQRAAQMLLLCEQLSAADAHQYGIVNDIIASETLEQQGLQMAQKLASMPSQAMAASRRLLHHNKDRYLQLIEQESAQFSALMRTNEFKDNMQKFLQK